MSQGLGALSAMLGRSLGMPTPSREPAYRYDGREADDPRRLPSHMDQVGIGRKLGWECEGCGASSPLIFRGIPSLVADAKRHDRDECC